MWWFIAAYAVLAVLCFYLLYANGLDLNFRLNNFHDLEKSVWQNFLSDQKEVVKMFNHDFFGLHCPWSRARSVRYRVQEARSMLKYRGHEKGWTVADCDDPANHRRIAYDCFVSRTRFWLKHLFFLCFAPFEMLTSFVIAFIVLIVILIYQGCIWVTTALRTKRA